MNDFQYIQNNFVPLVKFLKNYSEMFSLENSFSDILPELLDMLGRNLNPKSVRVELNDSEVKKVFLWPTKQVDTSTNFYKKTFNTNKTGDKNQIVFYFDESDKFPELILDIISNLLGNYISTQQLLSKVHSQRQLAESIDSISKKLNSTLNWEQLLSLFVTHLEDLVPYDTACVMLLIDEQLQLRAARGFENFGHQIDISNFSLDLRDAYLISEVLSGDEPIILNDAQQAQKWQWLPIGTHVRSWMSVPLIVNGKAIGLFSLDKAIPNFFTDRHAQMASALAKHASLAISNALIFSDVKDSNRELQRLSSQILKVQENERQRIARELHDHSGQALLALRAELQVLRQFLPGDDNFIRGQIDYLDEIVLSVSEEMEQLAFELRIPALNDFGLVPALTQYIDDFGKRMDYQVSFVHSANIERVSDDIEIVCYRMVQEALTNIAKHAKADKVEITLNMYEGFIYLVVKDNGCGFQIQQQKKGFGLVGIRERLFQVDGNLEIKSEIGQGTELFASIPLQGKNYSKILLNDE